MEKYFEKWTSKINEITLGASPSKILKIGGAAALPFADGEGSTGNPPSLAIEIADVPPTQWPEPLSKIWRDVWDDPVAWAKKAEASGADIVFLRLSGANPESLDRSPSEAARIARAVSEAVSVPVAVIGCEVLQKDLDVMPAVSRALSGRNALIGIATKDNYKTLSAAALADSHALISEAPIDINLAKQLNILISDAGFPSERIVVHQTTGALGYGYEYCYTIMERARIAGLSGDAMLATPMINFVGAECWKLKEAITPDDAAPGWGAFEKRGIIWEAVCAAGYLQGGADILVMCHPEALSAVRGISSRLSGK
ncbi:MAG: acetyl-CoA decarbonylase/synthase complex subunit delta [Endomicrobiia bacterium]|nr:acetyl-CoA decarbonylase/synthase complex subunit delta [Endomicrobiia bacterium]